jgi:large subunit ribosomal protein L32e
MKEMENKEKQRLLKIRKNINKKRPHFKRFESWRFKRIKNQWRKPRGIDNKMRTEESGWPKKVKIGYRGPVGVRGLHPSGFEEVLVWSPADLEKINPEIQVARIGGTVGGRKKEVINIQAQEQKIRVLNSGIQDREFQEFEELKDEDFEDLEDE